ncbi:MAG: HAMP domain-containing sensor histidine kinase [Pseudomonadota bacterium]
MLALMAAMALVWLALLAQAAYLHYAAMESNPGVHQLARGLARSLESMDGAAQARTLVRGMALTLNAMRSNVALLQGDGVLLQLQDTHGHLLHSSSAGIPMVALAGPSGHAQMVIDNQPYWAAWESAGAWRVLVAEPRVPDARLLGFMGEDLALSVLLALPLVGFPLWLAVRTGLRPLERLGAQIAARSAQDLRPLQSLPRERELQGLAQAFDALLGRLRAHLARERALVHDAAHELRTPMAVIATQAHVLLQAPEGPVRVQAADALVHALQRAAHLSEQLLTLAALEESAAPQATPLDLVALLQDCVAERSRWAGDLGVELCLEGPDSWVLPLDRQLLWSALGNVLDNALRHGCGPGAGREVLLRVGREGADVVVWIADDGPGIDKDEHAQVFERFWRSPRARSSGSGLGLTIAQQALGHLGGRVTLGPGLHGRGVGFTLRWPMAFG